MLSDVLWCPGGCSKGDCSPVLWRFALSVVLMDSFLSDFELLCHLMSKEDEQHFFTIESDKLFLAQSV